MQKLLQITLNDLRREFADNGIWLNLVIIPVALVFFIGFANGGFSSERRLPLDVVDLDGSAESARFIEELRAASPNLRVCPADAACEMTGLSEETAGERLRDGDTLALLIIPSGYAEALAAGELFDLIFRSEDQLNAPSIVQRAVLAQVQRVNGTQVARRTAEEVAAGISESRLTPDLRSEFVRVAYEHAQSVWTENPVRIIYNIPEGLSGTQQGFGQSTAGTGSMYVMFTVLAGTVALLAERRNWTLQRMVMMPVARWQILGGKMLTRFVMGMIQYGIVFGAGTAIMYFMAQVQETTIRAPFGSDVLALVLLMCAFTFCMTAISFFLAPLVRSEDQASGITLFIALTFAPLGGAWWPLAIVPEWMRTVGHLSPVAWVMDGMQSLMFENGSLMTIWPSLLVLFTAGAVLFVIGVLRFKYE